MGHISQGVVHAEKTFLPVARVAFGFQQPLQQDGLGFGKGPQRPQLFGEALGEGGGIAAQEIRHIRGRAKPSLDQPGADLSLKKIAGLEQSRPRLIRGKRGGWQGLLPGGFCFQTGKRNDQQQQGQGCQQNGNQGQGLCCPGGLLGQRAGGVRAHARSSPFHKKIRTLPGWNNGRQGI